MTSQGRRLHATRETVEIQQQQGAWSMQKPQSLYRIQGRGKLIQRRVRALRHSGGIENCSEVTLPTSVSCPQRSTGRNDSCSSEDTLLELTEASHDESIEDVPPKLRSLMR